MLTGCHLRIARPTDQLHKVVDFYQNILGFSRLGEFKNHDGFDGIMMGHSDAPYHLEFTSQSNHSVGLAPSQDHLLVFYQPSFESWQSTIKKIEESGAAPVQSYNPYWDTNGRTYEDPDGYRIVIYNGTWMPSP